MTEEYNDQLRPEQHLTEDYLSMTGMSQTERELLSEYQRLAKNLNQLSQSIKRLSTIPTPQILDNLRTLESKAALVSTLLKASVYSIFIQQEQGEDYQNEEEDYTGDMDVDYTDSGY